MLPRPLVVGTAEGGWGDSFGLFVTTVLTDAFDGGLSMVVDEHAYGRIIDGWQLAELYWQSLPIDELMTLVARFPSSKMLRRTLSLLARRQQRPDAFWAVCAAVRDSGDAAVARELVGDGERRYLDGDLNGAAQCFRAAIDEHPADVDAWCDLGVVLHAQGQLQAGRPFARALEVEPDHQDALLNRASWHLSCGLPAQAVHDAQRLLELQPGCQQAREILSAVAALAA